MTHGQHLASPPEGHRHGGPLLFCALFALAACGARGAPQVRPEPTERATAGRPLEVYRHHGLISGTDDFAVVGGFATLAGPADSTWLLFGMSLPAAALRFHRDGNGFTAGYRVRLRFLRDGVERAVSQHSEQVRVGTFQETGRTEESILFQDHVLLEPGRYQVELSVADSIGRGALDVVDTVDVPSHAGPQAAPVVLLVHRASGRDNRGSLPALILNSRRTVGFGAAPPRVYAEAYDTASTSLELQVTDAAGDTVLALSFPTVTAGTDALRHGTLSLPMDSLPLGVLRVAVRDAATGRTGVGETLIVSISEQWLVANYEEVIDYLSYIASRAEIDRLRGAATPAERRAAWEEFWTRRDPVPASAVNEYRDEFFERVRVAAEQFAELGRPGWRTDRGEVYIVLGAPDREVRGELSRRDVAGAVDAIEWFYDRGGVGGRLQLLFVDRDGFGRYEMTRNSELAFRSIASRLRVPAD